MDLTWLIYEKGKKVKFNPNTLCYASEPGSFRLLRKQLKRWNVGWFEVVSLHTQNLKQLPVLREFVFMAVADSIIGVGAFIGISIRTALSLDFKICLYFFLLDMILVTLIPLYKSAKTKNVRKLLSCLPSYYMARFVNTYFFFYALIKVLLLKQRISKFEKGH
jgi:cellulose synthase/poly-beta-1,6-N-acetylglucosamine synthase-like glycosyltransferase